MSDGIQAKCNYQPVRYAHIKVAPGESVLLTADPWSYLKAHLIQKEKGSRGTNAANLRRAVYYAGLAEDFYNTARTTELPAVGVVQYYGMLNLVKCFISTCGVELENVIEHHGLSLPAGETTQIFTTGTAEAADGVNIFSELAKELGTPVEGREGYSFKEICSHIPELHEITNKLGHLQTTSRKYLPVSIDFLVNEQFNKLYTEFRYQRKHDSTLPTAKLMRGNRAAYFGNKREEKGWVVFRSKRRKKLTTANWPIVYRNCLNEYDEFDLCSILTGSGYRYYCDLDPGKYHHLCYSLMAVFYIGTIVRYRPTVVADTFSSDLRPLVTEALAVLPQQFLYQMASRITGSICVVPHSQI